MPIETSLPAITPIDRVKVESSLLSPPDKIRLLTLLLAGMHFTESDISELTAAEAEQAALMLSTSKTQLRLSRFSIAAHALPDSERDLDDERQDEEWERSLDPPSDDEQEVGF